MLTISAVLSWNLSETTRGKVGAGVSQCEEANSANAHPLNIARCAKLSVDFVDNCSESCYYITTKVMSALDIFILRLEETK